MDPIPFSRDERERDPLLRRVAALPQEVAPPDDLWQAISARLDAQVPAATPAVRSRRAVTLAWPYAAAAGLAIAAVSALLTASFVQLLPESSGVVAAAPAGTDAMAVPVAHGPYSRLGPEYLETRAELASRFRERVALLPPETRGTVERNLRVIEQAARDIDTALAADPSSRLLNRLLLNTYQEELSLYSSINRVARPATAGAST